MQPCFPISMNIVVSVIIRKKICFDAVIFYLDKQEESQMAVFMALQFQKDSKLTRIRQQVRKYFAIYAFYLSWIFYLLSLNHDSYYIIKCYYDNQLLFCNHQSLRFKQHISIAGICILPE